MRLPVELWRDAVRSPGLLQGGRGERSALGPDPSSSVCPHDALSWAAEWLLLMTQRKKVWCGFAQASAHGLNCGSVRGQVGFGSMCSSPTASDMLPLKKEGGAEDK